MWIVELAFDGNPARLAARPAHRELLTGLHAQGVVRLAGPLVDETGADTGAVLVLDLPDRAAVDAFLAADPYYAAPGVEVRSIREYRPFLT
jgi:uncharacterized protein